MSSSKEPSDYELALEDRARLRKQASSASTLHSPLRHRSSQLQQDGSARYLPHAGAEGALEQDNEKITH